MASARERSTPNDLLPLAGAAETSLPGLPADFAASTPRTPATTDQLSPDLREEGDNPAVLFGGKALHSRPAAKYDGLTEDLARVDLVLPAVLDETLVPTLFDE
jgi:hypothetical protein